MDERTEREHEENEVRIVRAMEDTKDTVVGNMRGMIKEVKEEILESLLEIQNGHHPVQAHKIQLQFRDICDLNDENHRLKK